MDHIRRTPETAATCGVEPLGRWNPIDLRVSPGISFRHLFVVSGAISIILMGPDPSPWAARGKVGAGMRSPKGCRRLQVSRRRRVQSRGEVLEKRRVPGSITSILPLTRRMRSQSADL
ncbi:hypothetical protein CHELA17_60114 [Chelatococcus asaccharovorans]|nr:hypothetical protein CHELA17_60114 [Chelatococcus asaccharovorans]